MIYPPRNRRSFVSVVTSLASLLAFAGCTSTTMQVVDADNGYQPIAGATITRFALPRHHGDAFSPTPAEVQTADATGTVVLSRDSGRFVVSAPGKVPASLESTFMPKNLEVGLSAAPK